MPTALSVAKSLPWPFLGWPTCHHPSAFKAWPTATTSRQPLLTILLGSNPISPLLQCSEFLALPLYQNSLNHSLFSNPPFHPPPSNLAAPVVPTNQTSNTSCPSGEGSAHRSAFSPDPSLIWLGFYSFLLSLLEPLLLNKYLWASLALLEFDTLPPALPPLCSFSFHYPSPSSSSGNSGRG